MAGHATKSLRPEDEISHYRIVEIGEGPVRSPGEPPSDPVHFIWRPDNKRILIGVGTGSSDAVLIRNFRCA